MVISLYDSTTGDQLGEDLWFENSSVADADLSPDGEFIAFVSHGRATDYRGDALNVHELAARACEVLGRNASRSEWRDLTGGRPYRDICPDAAASAFDT